MGIRNLSANLTPSGVKLKFQIRADRKLMQKVDAAALRRGISRNAYIEDMLRKSVKGNQ